MRRPFLDHGARLLSLRCRRPCRRGRPPTRPRAAGITIDAASPEWTRRVEWGLARFRAAGLPLPAIAISVHDDNARRATATAGCSGRATRRGPPLHAEPRRVPAARLITLHELAHAWAETQLTRRTTGRFLASADSTSGSTAGPPHEWGAEHAAEVVSWGLMDEPIPIVRIDDASPDELAVAFDLLVGESPLWTKAGETVRR